jgi:hypothetical protein
MISLSTFYAYLRRPPGWASAGQPAAALELLGRWPWRGTWPGTSEPGTAGGDPVVTWW